MRPRRSAGALTASPVLVGAVTVLVAIVAVFLSYNANTGLPFVPTYDLKANLPSGAQLVRGFEVRIGGARVGQISTIEPKQREDGSTYAQITMKLDKEIEPLPANTERLVRPRSALGLKYVELRPGRSEQGLESLEPVAANLADPETGLDSFFVELADAAGEAAPVAEQQAELFVNLDITFTALARIARPYLQETISEGPPSEEVAIREFPLQRPFLRNNAAFFRELRPGIATLPASAPVLADAFEAGTEVLPKTPPMNRDLANVFDALADFSADRQVRLGIDQLTRLSSSLRPTLRFLAPVQTTCNYVTLFFRNAASVLTDGDANGTWQRFVIIPTPEGRNNEGGPSSAPANGPSEENHLHTNPYPNTAAPGQTQECEAGNERYLVGRTVIGNQPGDQGTVTQDQPEANASAEGTP